MNISHENIFFRFKKSDQAVTDRSFSHTSIGGTGVHMQMRQPTTFYNCPLSQILKTGYQTDGRTNGQTERPIRDATTHQKKGNALSKEFYEGGKPAEISKKSCHADSRFLLLYQASSRWRRYVPSIDCAKTATQRTMRKPLGERKIDRQTEPGRGMRRKRRTRRRRKAGEEWIGSQIVRGN